MPIKLGKRAQNQSLMIVSVIVILAEIITGYDLILLDFLPYMTPAYYGVHPATAATKCSSSIVLIPRSRAFLSLDPAFSP